ncbi:MAG: sulfotransferase, partial [Planctomycetota bacterium]
LLAARCEEMLRDHEASAQSLETACRLDPGNADAAALRARLSERSNDLETARRWADRALQADPTHPLARLVDAKIVLRSGAAAVARDRLEKLTADKEPMARLTPAMRAAVYHELGNTLDRLDEYGPAWDAYTHSTRHRLQDPSWSRIDAREAFGRIRDSRQLIREGFLETCPRPAGAASPRVVFLVGLPRSGTTLTERLLSEAGDLRPTDERTPLAPLLSEIRRGTGTYADALRTLSDADCRLMRARYFEEAGSILGGLGERETVLDKLPLNLIDLPLIARVFGDAPVLMCLRDPLDACLSNAQQHMAPNASMKALATIETGARFAAELLELWCDARETLRMPWMESRYEELITDATARVRSLLSHCGVEPRASGTGASTPQPERASGTPSYEAVSGPINNRAVGRWQRYGPHIDPVVRTAAESTLRPLRERLGYGDRG